MLSPRRLAAVTAAALVIGFTASNVLSHGGDTTLIHACVAKDGTIRIVAAAVACRSQETALDWNITGPQGLPGQDGAPGAQGLPGQDGAPGAQGLRGPSDAFVDDAGIDPQPFAESNNELTVATLSLTEGKYTLSGKVLVGNRDSLDAQMTCTLLSTASGYIDTASARLFAGAPSATGSMTTLPLAGSLVVGPAGDNVRIQCGSTSPDGFAQFGKLNAVKVETLTPQ